MSFTKYRCWQPQDVDEIAPIDVGSLEHAGGHTAIFLATHQPLQLLQVPTSGAQDGALVTEDQVLAKFNKPIGNDPEIIVISGAVGTGKSHMVKWLHAKSEGRTEWHQVYIEKRNTNLRRVIDTILKGLDGPRVRELRDQLQVASSAIRDLPEAKSSVITKLSHFVGFPNRGDSAPTSPHIAEARKQLVHILNDPVLREHLLREGGAIHRITRLGLEGLSVDDDDEQDLFFHVEDLPLAAKDLADASGPAKQAVKLLNSHEGLRGAAVEVLNEELAAAKSAVFIGSGIDLIGLFDEVRQELAQRGLDLMLYIEDLVLLHGIDRELTQVFTEGRGTGGERCGMRVALAVTDGYLNSAFATLTSRATHYSLNLSLGEHVTSDTAVGFVGRYLNAIRQGPKALHLAYEGTVGDDWVPNHCSSCDHLETCHEAFGTDAAGHGLYPLNRTAVERLVRLAGLAAGDEARFDPREVLRNVVRDPLATAAEELPAARFPSEQFAAVIDPNRRSVSVEVRARLDGTPEGRRYLALLAYWAQVREPVDSIVALDPRVHTAFEVAPYEGAAEITGGGDDDFGRGGGKTGPTTSWPAIDEWARGEKNLPANDARPIRQWILDAVVDQVRNGASGIQVASKDKKHQVGNIVVVAQSIRIDGAQGGGTEVAREFEIELKRNPRNAVLMKAIRTAQDEHRWPSDRLDLYADMMGRVDRWAAKLVKMATKAEIDLAPSVRLLAVTSQPAFGAAADAGARLEAALQVVLPADQRSPALKAWAKAALNGRVSALAVVGRTLGGAKGTGNVSFLDGAAIATHLTKAGSTRRLGDLVQGSSDLVDRQNALREAQHHAETTLGKEVDLVVDRLAGHLGAGERWDALCVSVDEALDRAHQQAVLPAADDRSRLDELRAEVPNDAIDVLRRMARAGSDARDLWDYLPDPVPGLQALDRYCKAVASVFDALEQRLADDAGLGPQTIGPGATATAFRGLADVLDGVVGGSDR